MTRPVGTVAKTKDNSKKNYRAAEEFKLGKKIGRLKQRWVPEGFVEHTGQPCGGYWTKEEK